MTQNDTHEFLIVAIGASAGGLEALEQFFRKLPADVPMAFVVVQHLSPDHESALPQLLAKYTSMRVQQVQENMKAAPGRVYVIPPDATMSITEGMLHLVAPAEPRGHRTPIDSFFSSLAEDRGEASVCIMLSGTGTDGTRGLRAIKEYGGMAMAQTLESAKYDSILRSAISTGLVDHVLPVEEMPGKLIEYSDHLASLNGQPRVREQLGPELARIHRLLRQRAGHDFSQYKEGTIARRLERRIKVLQIKNVKEYVQVLEQRPEEADRLFCDLLIGVTQFFRDSEAFETLGREVIPKLFDGKEQDAQVRVCIVGCASGEEAYSIGMLLLEHEETLQKAPRIQIFATDIDERSLETARKGRYPDSIVEHVTAERLERFFIKQEGFYQVKRELRERCIFSSHSFIKDPPFSRLDLISCRNVMIYLGPELQEKMIPLFHYALRPGGYLFIGPSENVSGHRDLFSAIDKTHKIFQRKESLPRPAIQFPLGGIDRTNRSTVLKQADHVTGDLSRHLEHIILQRYRPACVTVKENGDGVYFSGQLGRFLEPPTGGPDTNVLNMARDTIRIPLRSALHRAAATRTRVETRLSLQTGGATQDVHITVEPLPEFNDANLYMIAFAEVASGAPLAAPIEAGAADAIHHLESQLQTVQEYAQTTLEELETTNEELQSSNEELQSTNEELETSKEELQSFNEELETVNVELNRKVGELDHANSDLQNLLNSTQIATIFLDLQMQVKNFTPAAGAVFHLIAGDVGRPITDLAARFSEGELIDDIEEVLRTLETRERQVTAPVGQYYHLRILPYRTVNNVIDGVVLTFMNVTVIKQAEQRALEAQLYTKNIVETVREPLLVLDSDMRVKSANKAFYDMFQAFEDMTIGKSFYEIDDQQWNIPALRRALTEVLPQRKALKEFQVELELPGVGNRVMMLNARQIERQKDQTPLILLSIEDVTESREMLLRLNEDLKHIAYATSHDLQEPLRMVVSYTQLLAREYRGRLDEKADQFIGYAVEGATRMEMLLRNLREYWSVTENWHEPRVRVDCNTVLEKAAKLLDRAIRECDTRITHEPLPVVTANELSLVLLFQNLIGNAINTAKLESRREFTSGRKRRTAHGIFP